MAFESDAIAYYTFHVTSLPLSLFLFLAYRNHKYHSSIAYFALTLFFSSINSCYLAFVKDGNLGDTANTFACNFQAFFISYLNSSTAIWPVCIESNMTLILRRRRQQQREWSRKQVLLSCMALALGLPLFFTTIAFVLAVSEDGLKPWKLYYCMLSEPAIGPAIGIYFVSLCAVIATIIMTAWNVKLIFDQEEEIDSEDDDDDLSRRIIIFGIIITLPICLATLARSFILLMNNTIDSNGTWPDFLLVTIPYFTFMIFGIRSVLIKRFLPNSTPCQRNRGDSLLLRFSIINPTLIREVTGEEETTTEKSSSEKSSDESTPRSSTPRSSTPGPSTFSRRSCSDPFSHRKNPSLTINVPHHNPKNPKNQKNQKNRISKGKNRSSVSIRQSFLARALSINKEPENSFKYNSSSSVENGNVNSRNLQKAMKAVNFANKKHRGNRYSVNNNNVFDFEMTNGKPRFLKTFSFEYRKRAESVIGIPPEYIDFDDDTYDPVPSIPSLHSNRSINEHIIEAPSSIVDYKKERREHSRHPKPPPLAICQNKSLVSKQKSPSFFFLASDHYDDGGYVANDDVYDEYANLPATPSFGMPSSSKVQTKRNTRSSLSSKSNNSTGSSKSSHGGGLRLTPKDNIPVRILNRKSLLDALPSPTYEENNA